MKSTADTFMLSLATGPTGPCDVISGAIFHTYLLRHMPAPLWLEFQAKVRTEGTTARAVLVRLVQQYVSE